MRKIGYVIFKDSEQTEKSTLWLDFFKRTKSSYYKGNFLAIVKFTMRNFRIKHQIILMQEIFPRFRQKLYNRGDEPYRKFYRVLEDNNVKKFLNSLKKSKSKNFRFHVKKIDVDKYLEDYIAKRVVKAI